jgi:hypothetical protein
MQGKTSWLKERIRRWWSGRPSSKANPERNKKPTATSASPETLQRWENEGGAPVGSRPRPESSDPIGAPPRR